MFLSLLSPPRLRGFRWCQLWCFFLSRFLLTIHLLSSKTDKDTLQGHSPNIPAGVMHSIVGLLTHRTAHPISPTETIAAPGGDELFSTFAALPTRQVIRLHFFSYGSCFHVILLKDVQWWQCNLLSRLPYGLPEKATRDRKGSLHPLCTGWIEHSCFLLSKSCTDHNYIISPGV